MARKSSNNSLLEWSKVIIVALALAFLVRTFLFTPIVVDGPSMQPTLYDRDQMIVNKITYRLSDPKRFDIVVFHATSQKDFIKRVIGLPGEHIMMKDNELYVDGEKVEESFSGSEDSLTYDFQLEELPGGHETIPEGFVFVLGDNRTNSTDSRTIGLVPVKDIIGKTNLIYWPLKRVQIVKE
ncbi:MAG TPA: signal peptidase I [Bacillota bacterium]|nr:signal peptidase I [Bacillota bacterium]